MTMINVNGHDHEVRITSAGYLYIDGNRVNNVPITPLHVPDGQPEAITKYCRAWAHRHYRMVNG